jgi:hypothetical protein
MRKLKTRIRKMKLTIDLCKQLHEAVEDFAKGNEMLISEAINYALADYFSRFEREEVYSKLFIDRAKPVNRGIKNERRVTKVLGNLRNFKRLWTA